MYNKHAKFDVKLLQKEMRHWFKNTTSTTYINYHHKQIFVPPNYNFNNLQKYMQYRKSISFLLSLLSYNSYSFNYSSTKTYVIMLAINIRQCPSTIEKSSQISPHHIMVVKIKQMPIWITCCKKTPEL